MQYVHLKLQRSVTLIRKSLRGRLNKSRTSPWATLGKVCDGLVFKGEKPLAGLMGINFSDMLQLCPRRINPLFLQLIRKLGFRS